MELRRIQPATTALMFIGLILLVGCKKQQASTQAKAGQEVKPPPAATPVTPAPSRTARAPGSELPVGNAAVAPEKKPQDALQAHFTKKLQEMYGPDPAKDCLPKTEELFEVLSEANGDLDGDGQDEFAVLAISCHMVNIPDLYAVLKMGPDGKLTEMPFAKRDPNQVFPHMDPKSDVHGAPGLAIVKGRLIWTQGIYRESDPNCCPTGGTRREYYRWNGRALVLEDIVDSSDSFWKP